MSQASVFMVQWPRTREITSTRGFVKLSFRSFTAPFPTVVFSKNALDWSFQSLSFKGSENRKIIWHDSAENVTKARKRLHVRLFCKASQLLDLIRRCSRSLQPSRPCETAQPVDSLGRQGAFFTWSAAPAVYNGASVLWRQAKFRGKSLRVPLYRPNRNVPTLILLSPVSHLSPFGKCLGHFLSKCHAYELVQAMVTGKGDFS